MDEKVDHDVLDDALRRCGASWDAAQSHGLLTGRLAVAGVPAGPEWLQQVLEGTNENDALRSECGRLLDALYQATYWQLSERLSEFVPLLPDDDTETAARTTAMAHWCEGFLHGLVSVKHGDAYAELVEYLRVAAQLAYEELSDLRHAATEANDTMH